MDTKFFKVSEIRPEQVKEYLVSIFGVKIQDKVYNQLKDLVNDYPGFDYWFNNIVYPDVIRANGNREILFSFAGENNKVVSSIAILKKTETEKKICTFRINEECRSQGLGEALLKACMVYLETDKPIITISDLRMDMFQKLLQKYNFKEMQKLPNYYQDGSIEHVYNGELGSKVSYK
ncbi:hypothetical protein SAMN05660742_12911 [Propionispira arboris]|uniref:N-acetyltransferase domain-containing protein n=1 Tax=Propionispira arboris TaxID=84035 RepID=A0A1H7D1Z8_9FIRM|nr:GNAT family N-acetyltransferase [Propionispira arboris]SEJ95943.1 hypothetical protein SAMN05660742_12911 [Propionispira arboris]